MIALTFALSLPVAGLVAYRYLGGLVRLRQGVRFGVLALRHRQAAAQLVDERRAILKDLEAAKTAYLSATRGSSW